MRQLSVFRRAGGAVPGALLAGLVLFLAVAAPQRAAGQNDLSEALLLPELFAIMATEGRENADAVEDELLNGRGGTQWRTDVARTYDPDRLLAQFMQVLDAELADSPDVRADVMDFAESDMGRRVLRLEIDARAALLDPDVSALAHDVLADLRAERAPRLEMVRERIAVNDLVELNVALGLNTSMSYFHGLMTEAPGGMSGPMTSLLGDVWEQEHAIRAETEDWIESYFLLAYQPLSDEALRSYIAFSASESGQKFNTAMFRAFDQVFGEVSLRLGSATGRALQHQDL